MKDRIGNTIVEEGLVRWEIPTEVLKNLVFTVVKVSDGGLATPQGQSPAFLQLTVAIPINNTQGEPVLTDFLCVMNPNNEQLLNALSGKRVQ